MSFNRKQWDKKNKVGKAKRRKKERTDTVKLEQRRLDRELRKVS